jgi:hypothetical protein
MGLPQSVLHNVLLIEDASELERVTARELEAIRYHICLGKNRASHDYVKSRLGLALARELTEATEGTVTFDSLMDAGSYFALRLPQAHALVLPLRPAVSSDRCRHT